MIFLFFYIHLLSPIVGLLINITSQLLITRNINSFGLLKTIYVSFGIGYFSVILCEAAYFIDTKIALTIFLGQLLLNSFTYIALGYCYFHFINLGETGRRIRIVRELLESNEGLSFEELIKCYNSQDILKIRLKRMSNNKQIIIKNDKYYIKKPFVLWMAKIIIILKCILLNKKSELG